MKKAPLGKAGRDLAESLVQEHCIVAPSECSTAQKYRQRRGARSTSLGTIDHPHPRRGVYGSDLGTIVPAAPDVWRVLHLDKAKAAAQSNGVYPCRPAPLGIDDLQKHLDGALTLAFSVCWYKRALFAVLDVDARFNDLLPVIRNIVTAVGGEQLSRAIFCTNGSDSGRGKIVITFAKPVARLEAGKLIHLIRRQTRASEAAQCVLDNQLSAYPQRRSGGIVRILGRNVRRAGPLETAFSLDGEAGLAHLQPLTAAKLAEIVAPLSDAVAPWVKRYTDMPWVRAEGTDAHFRHMIALALEAIRVHGRTKGLSVYEAWIARIREHSPNLGRPSLKSGDSRNVLEHSRERAWKYARERPLSWKPLNLQVQRGVPHGVVCVYSALIRYVSRKGLPRDCFAIDYERIAELLDTSKSTAHRWIERALEVGAVVIHDRGKKHSKGVRGKCTLFGLVGQDDSPEKMLAAGRQNERIRKRALARPIAKSELS